MLIPDAARLARVSYWTIYAKLLRGEIPGRRGLHGKWEVDRDAVERFAKERAAAESNGHDPEPAT